MNKPSALLAALFFAVSFVTISSAEKQFHIAYPVTRTTNHVDVYHGVTVADPYRWLEDDNSSETKAWVQAQNQVTFAFLKEIPQRDAIRKRLEQLWNYERYGVP
ncbi:MAG TPA: S9 family peptidase, partial [Verrucomicrobiae bacterium]|nr:S9 family peptidase [Verrucomicrobiae bacterium]